MAHAPSSSAVRLPAWLRLAVSLLLLYILLQRVDWSRLVSMVHRARWEWIFPAVGLLALGFWLSARRWQAVLHDLGLAEPLGRLLYWNLMAFFWSQFLPTTVGGDGFRIWRLLGRYPNRKTAALASVFLDRLYGYLALLSVHGLLLPWTASLWWRQPWLKGMEGALAAGLMVVVGLIWGRGRWSAWFSRAPAWLQPWLTRAEAGLRMLWHRSPQTVMRAWVYSALFVLGNGLMLWCYLRTWTASVPLLPVMYASTVAAILGALPITLNGLGLTEAVLVMALTPAGLSPESILLAAFLHRAVNLSVGLLGGAVYALEGLLPTHAQSR